MGAMNAALRIILVMSLFPGCVSDYGETPFACAKSSACPEGYRCVNQVCRREGTTPPPPPGDAKIDQPNWPPHSDAAPDVWTSDQYVYKKEGIATFPDLPGGLSCKEIDACYGTCPPSNQACFETCFQKGSPDGKAKMDALEKCDNLAWNGTCYNACNFGSQATCNTCLDTACAKQLAACLG